MKDTVKKEFTRWQELPALIPALSRWERENHPPSLHETKRCDCRMAFKKAETLARCSLFTGEKLYGRKAFAIWAPEPTPNPSQEGNCLRAFAVLLPSREGLGVGRFMRRVRVRVRFHNVVRVIEFQRP